MHYFLPRSIQLAIALAGSTLLSACGIFSSEYNLNASRGGRPVEDRPLYEPENQSSTDNDTASDEDAGEDRELIFEDDTETKPDNKTSELPDIPKTEEALLRQEAVSYAKTFMGTKYKLGGTTPRGGFDCSGFTSYVMKKVDVAISRTSQAQENNGKKVRLKKVQPGDLIFYRRSPLGKVFHVSIVVANKEDGIYVIHSTSRGVVIDNVTKSSYWSPKISSARSVF